MSAPRPRVIDASVAVKWFVASDEPGVEAAFGVLAELQDEPLRFVVPETFFAEVHAVLCRKLASVEGVTAALDRLWALGLQRIPFDRRTVRLATELAIERRISGYDATYLAVAKLVHGVWLTFDDQAHRRVAPLGLSRLL